VAGERSLIARHAGTVLVGQLAVMAFGVTDTIIAGRYSEHALAALSVGAAIFVSVYVSLMGALQALLPVWAELHGAGRSNEVGRSVRQSLYLAGIAVAVGMAMLLLAGRRPALDAGAARAMRGEVEAYLVGAGFRAGARACYFACSAR
jgi:MATE family multidrug resistance protein